MKQASWRPSSGPGRNTPPRVTWTSCAGPTTNGSIGWVTFTSITPARAFTARANRAGISLRTGCFCNPGAGEIAHGLTREEMEEAFRDDHRMTLDQFLTVVLRKHHKSAGAIRVSLGIASNFRDVYRFVKFAQTFLDRSVPDMEE